VEGEGELTAGGGAEQDDEDENEPIYNPLKLPLGFDGKPIPYWLYKLHGLNQVCVRVCVCVCVCDVEYEETNVDVLSRGASAATRHRSSSARFAAT
jgi:hypothetical protein